MDFRMVAIFIIIFEKTGYIYSTDSAWIIHSTDVAKLIECENKIPSSMLDRVSNKMYILLATNKVTLSLNLFDINNGCNRYWFDQDENNYYIHSTTITKFCSNNVSYPVMNFQRNQTELSVIDFYFAYVFDENRCILIRFQKISFKNGIDLIFISICC